MPSSDIIGHKKQREILQWALEKGRLHHAYLFVGPEGVGKRTVALSLAKGIHCLERAHDFCNRCANCVRIQSGNHPDVRILEPATGKKEITIQQVRELERELSFRTFSGRKKIAIVDPASLMNLFAQNALLKTLEEPPGDSLLVLISTNTGGLLPTLLSRCLRLSFAPLPLKEVEGFLISEKKMKQEEAGLLAALTMGSLGRALSPEMEPLVEKRKEWLEKISSLHRADCRGWMALAEGLAGAREEAVKFLEWLAIWYRDIVIYCAAGNVQGIANRDMLKRIEEQAHASDLEQVLFLLTQASRTMRRIQRNVNRRMALENFFTHVVGLH